MQPPSPTEAPTTQVKRPLWYLNMRFLDLHILHLGQQLDILNNDSDNQLHHHVRDDEPMTGRRSGGTFSGETYDRCLLVAGSRPNLEVCIALHVRDQSYINVAAEVDSHQAWSRTALVVLYSNSNSNPRVSCGSSRAQNQRELTWASFGSTDSRSALSTVSRYVPDQTKMLELLPGSVTLKFIVISMQLVSTMHSHMSASQFSPVVILWVWTRWCGAE